MPPAWQPGTAAMLKRAPAFLLPALLAACTVGPRYEEPPDLATPARFDQATAEATADPAKSDLWRGFGSPELDRMITRALAANTTIAQASARLAETRALSGLSIYSWFPTVTAAGDRQKAQYFVLQVVSDDPGTWGDNKIVKQLAIAPPEGKK